MGIDGKGRGRSFWGGWRGQPPIVGSSAPTVGVYLGLLPTVGGAVSNGHVSDTQSGVQSRHI